MAGVAYIQAEGSGLVRRGHPCLVFQAEHGDVVELGRVADEGVDVRTDGREDLLRGAVGMKRIGGVAGAVEAAAAGGEVMLPAV